ncbi:MAG: hypothetical protein PHP02_03870 [Eubacteriales bacterium]|nr:hypothetical protein [Eubacteriales bacterium]
MSENILIGILDAEKKAEAMLAEAQSEASEAIKNAQAQVREEERQAAVMYRELYRAIVARKEQEVLAQLEAEARTYELEIESHMKNAQSRLDQAADMIVQEVLADGHR